MALDIFEELDILREELRSEDWDTIEDRYIQLARKHAGAKMANLIAKIGMADYQQQLEPALKEALEAAQEDEASAVTFEYDVDNGWESTFFVCPNYMMEEDESDEWAAEWDREIEGPGLPEFADIYAEHGGFSGEDAAIAITLLLIARTACAMGRVVAAMPENGVAICMGYHDQESLWRIREMELAEDDDFDEDEEDEDEDDSYDDDDDDR